MSCGECTLCCKTHRVKDLPKERFTWCDHCDKGKGCKIYDTRPQSCRDFECFWLQSQRTEAALPPEMRPDRCGVVMSTMDVALIVTINDGIDPKQGMIGRYLNAVIDKGMCLIMSRRGKTTVVNPTPDIWERVKYLMGQEG